MKGTDIFDEEFEEIEFAGMNFSDSSDFSPTDRVHSPVQANISPDAMVDLVSNSFVILSGTWEEVAAFVTDNWGKLNGQYQVSAGGAVLHTFIVAR